MYIKIINFFKYYFSQIKMARKVKMGPNPKMIVVVYLITMQTAMLSP